ncbi:MAG: EamA family transporter [Brachybacterium tyrofermentans]|uniref:EamA family transporter n=1 Tax=Brachybacterium tyrofermentans TaxID=47848 RepID=UPI000A1A4BD2|nr:DMT family transporter [Brachybacterium tyrofermentans]SLN04983.1 putative integral membrane protein [Corynebacterium xerosis]
MTISASPASTGSAPVTGAPRGGSGVPLTPVMFILGSCISLQFGAALATQLFPELGPWGTTSLRLGIAALVLLVIVRPKLHRFTREQWIAVLLFGGAIGAMNGAFYASISRIPLGTAVAIEFLGPLAVSAVLSTRRTDLLWVVLALGGVSLFGLESLTGDTALDGIGVLFALIAAVFWGMYVLCSARVGRLVPGQDGLAVAMAVGALVVLPLGAPGAVAGLVDLRLLGLAVGTALLASVLPYTLELAALRRLPRHVFGILLSLEPVIALFAGVLLIGQDATALRIAAALLVVGASVGITLTARGAAPDQPQPVDEEPGWELPTPTHATLTGEMPVVFPEEGLGADEAPGAFGTDTGRH